MFMILRRRHPPDLDPPINICTKRKHNLVILPLTDQTVNVVSI